MRDYLYNRNLDLLYALSSFVTTINGEDRKTKHVLSKYKNKYLGDQCFVIGNGPSLTPEDLTILKQENVVCFASNKIYRIFDKTDWRPTFYGVFDESIADEECISRNKDLTCEVKFFRKQGWYKYRNINNAVYINSWYSRKYLDSPGFSLELSDGIYTIATVTYALLQLARYMGFSEIYLLGMDNRYKFTMDKNGVVSRNENIISHFGEEEVDEPLPASAPATWELDTAYLFADEFSRKNGFRIFNATRGGYLEKFERISFEEVIYKIREGK